MGGDETRVEGGLNFRGGGPLAQARWREATSGERRGEREREKARYERREKRKKKEER